MIQQQSIAQIEPFFSTQLYQLKDLSSFYVLCLYRCVCMFT